MVDRIIKTRLEWIKLYLDKQDAGYVCRHCGISRPTLRKWFRRYQTQGVSGFYDLSRKPVNFPGKKLNEDLLIKILVQGA